MNKSLFLLVGLLSFFFQPVVTAQGLGRSGALTIGVERISGFVTGSREFELQDTGADRDDSYTLLAFLWTQDMAYINRPRLGFDYFPIQGLSVGGSFGIVTASVEREAGAGGLELDGTGVLVSPRVGYYISFNHWAGFWPRGGITYYTILTDVDNDLGEEYQFSLSLEAMFALAPARHFAIILGPIFDLGLFGERDLGAQDADVQEMSFGLWVGLLGWVNL